MYVHKNCVNLCIKYCKYAVKSIRVGRKHERWQSMLSKHSKQEHNVCWAYLAILYLTSAVGKKTDLLRLSKAGHTQESVNQLPLTDQWVMGWHVLHEKALPNINTDMCMSTIIFTQIMREGTSAISFLPSSHLPIKMCVIRWIMKSAVQQQATTASNKFVTPKPPLTAEVLSGHYIQQQSLRAVQTAQ